MKLNLIPTKKLAMVSAAFCAAMLAFSNNANALTIGDGHEFGFVTFGIPAGDTDRLNYVNHLVGMGLGSQDDFLGQRFTRSSNAFAQLPQATLDGVVRNTTGNNAVNLGAGSLYTYLLAKYDGPNYGTEVWYVGDLSGIITIPATAGGYGLSGWMLFGPGVPGVPDGGTSAMLLGAALGALGMARRFLKI
jgi:hypothetical protein